MGLPAGSTILGVKNLSGPQITKLSEGVVAEEGTIQRLKDIRQYTSIYQDMFKAGKIKLSTSSDGKLRILAGFIPTTEDEKKAAAAWQESAEYMNMYRSALNAAGYRSIPSYDNMLALRGQLWQDKTILNKTLDDSINFMQNRLDADKHLLGQTKPEDVKDANPY
jgi:hypothetical protein